MKYILPLAIVFFLNISLVQAQNIDVSKVPCGAYMKNINNMMSSEDSDSRISASIFMSWLYGHVAAQKDHHIYDPKEFNAVFTRLGDECTKNPEINVLKAIHSVWDK